MIHNGSTEGVLTIHMDRKYNTDHSVVGGGMGAVISARWSCCHVAGTRLLPTQFGIKEGCANTQVVINMAAALP